MARVRVVRSNGGGDSLQSIRVGLAVGGVVLALLFLSSTYYQVEPEEVGVVTRFGKYLRTTNPGLHFKWPWGIEQVQTVKTQRRLKEEFGFRTVQAGRRSAFSEADHKAEALMLTGDLNAADVEWVVQYRISDPRAYLFQVRDPEDTLRDLTESVMRAVVGDRSVYEVLTVGREEINVQVKEQLQKPLTDYGTGLTVELVQLQTVDPPDAGVMQAFNDVNQAEQEKERAVNQATQEYNDRYYVAVGEAEKTIAEAEGYRIDRINRALGETSRFLSLLGEYQKAPEVTRTRLYLESMTEVLPRLGPKVIVDAELQSALPLLHLGAQGGSQ